MTPDPTHWQNRSPGDLDHVLPAVQASNVDSAVASAQKSAADWAATPLDARIAALRGCQTAIREKSEALARRIAEETGKPLTETRGELGAAVAKFDAQYRKEGILFLSISPGLVDTSLTPRKYLLLGRKPLSPAPPNIKYEGLTSPCSYS